MAAGLGSPDQGIVTTLQALYFSGSPAGIAEGGSGSFTGELRVFPNPAQSVLNVQGMDAAGRTTLTVRNVLGQTMMVRAVDEQSNVLIDIHSWAAGTYYLQLSDGKKEETRPFLKLR
jgi:Na+/H+-dicarboxylate symporter